MRRIACFFVMMCLLLVLSGCAKAPAVRETAGAAPVRLSALQYELENIAVDFNSMWYFRQLEAETGVHVDFSDVKDSEWNASVSLAFARDRMPDLILRGSLDVEEYGVSRHLLVPLDGYIDGGFLPNYASRLNSSLRRQLTASDGHIYQLGFLISQGVNTSGHFFINRTWLDRLGLAVPETVEAFTEVMRRFRDGDPNGNGKQDEIPMEFSFDDNITGVYNLFSFFGLPLNEDYVYVDGEGAVHFAPEEDAFLEAAEWMHGLCAEGLMDVDFVSQGSNIWAEKVNEGNTGFFSYWRLQNTALDPAVAAGYEIMLPVHTEGGRACMPRLIDLVEFGAALTTDNPDIEASLRWLDAQFETEHMLVAQNGPVGETLTLREDGRYEVASVPADNALYQTVPVICGQFFAPADYYASVYVPASHRQEKAGYCAMYEAAGVLEEVSAKYLTTVAGRGAEESGLLTRLKARLKAVVDAEIVRVVLQGPGEGEAEQFRRRLREAGAEEYRSVYQQIYSRWQKESENRAEGE